MPGVLRKQSAQQGQQQFTQLQQAAVAQIKAGQYQDALANVNQMLETQPGHPICEQLRQVLMEKLDLDASSSGQQDPEESETSNEDSSEDDASSVASSAASEDVSEQSDSSDNEDANSNQAEVQAVDTCDTLHMTPNSSALSAQQRRQLRDQLAEQLDDLRVQQAAQSMNMIGI